jgi:ribonuclease inhibitor
MRAIHIDCANIESADAFWQRYLDVVQPDGGEMFGRNLDAFWDAVEGGGPGWPGDVELVFTNSRLLEPLKTAGGASFLAGLIRISEQATHAKLRFL